MQIKLGDLVRHKYLPHYGVGLVVKVSDPYWIQVQWAFVSTNHECQRRRQRVENLVRIK